jgi:hypothetical protein
VQFEFLVALPVAFVPPLQKARTASSEFDRTSVIIFGVSHLDFNIYPPFFALLIVFVIIFLI